MISHSASQLSVPAEPKFRGLTHLITQRSRVQIPPPLRVKLQVRAGFVGHRGPGFDVPCQHTVCGRRRGCRLTRAPRRRITKPGEAQREVEAMVLWGGDPEVRTAVRCRSSDMAPSLTSNTAIVVDFGRPTRPPRRHRSGRHGAQPLVSGRVRPREREPRGVALQASRCDERGTATQDREGRNRAGSEHGVAGLAWCRPELPVSRWVRRRAASRRSTASAEASLRMALRQQRLRWAGGRRRPRPGPCLRGAA
jgi:hypothetical protein